MIYFVLYFQVLFISSCCAPWDTSWNGMINKSDKTSASFHYHLSIAMYNAILNFHFLLPPLKLNLSIDNILHPLVFLFFIPSCCIPWDLMCLYFYFFNFLSPLDIITINNIFHPLFCNFFIPSCCKSLLWLFELFVFHLNSLYIIICHSF